MQKITPFLWFDRQAEDAAKFYTGTLAPEGHATRVNWKMQGPVPYLFKIMHMLCDMDKMRGRDFEAGLAAMKAAAEK